MQSRRAAGDVQFAAPRGKYLYYLGLRRIPYYVVLDDEVGVSSGSSHLQGIQRHTQCEGAVAPLLQSCRQFYRLQSLTSVECLLRQFVVGGGKLFAAVNEVCVAATYYFSLGDVKFIKIALCILAILVDTCQTAYLAQVGGVYAAFYLQRSYGTYHIVAYLATQRSRFCQFHLLRGKVFRFSPDAGYHVLLHIKLVVSGIKK